MFVKSLTRRASSLRTRVASKRKETWWWRHVRGMTRQIRGILTSVFKQLDYGNDIDSMNSHYWPSVKGIHRPKDHNTQIDFMWTQYRVFDIIWTVMSLVPERSDRQFANTVFLTKKSSGFGNTSNEFILCHGAVGQGHNRHQLWPWSTTWHGVTTSHSVNALRPRRNGRHFVDDIFKCIF